jgi:serine/threonine protein kinase
MSVIHLREKGTAFPCAIMNRNSPPEAVRLIQDELYSLRKHRSALHDPIIAEPSLDIWSFGKLFFEALFAEPLFPHSHSISFSKDFKTVETIGGWNEDNLEQVTSDLLHIGVTMLGVDLVKQCLQPHKADRLQSMDQVLRHDFWKELKTVSGQRKN